MTDADGDGQVDGCDACPNDADNDIDGDGVCGDVDNCMDTPNVMATRQILTETALAMHVMMH